MKDFLKAVGIIGTIPILGGTSAGFAGNIAARYGHTFISGPQSAYFGMIGAISNLASMIFAVVIIGDYDFDNNSLIDFLMKFAACHAIAPVALFGITAAAANMNLIATKVSLLGTIVLIGTGIFGNSVLSLGMSLLPEGTFKIKK
jgi:hypothetical protein